MRTILVVDDSDVTRRYLVRALRCPEHDVLDTDRAERALDLARMGLAHVVVTDQGLPGMSGLELLRVLRAERPDVPGILLTGDDDPVLRRAAEALGATFLVKPISPEDLRFTVAALVAGD
jgi:DNA-binding response OmpR family regulator